MREERGAEGAGVPMDVSYALSASSLSVLPE